MINEDTRKINIKTQEISRFGSFNSGFFQGVMSYPSNYKTSLAMTANLLCQSADYLAQTIGLKRIDSKTRPIYNVFGCIFSQSLRNLADNADSAATLLFSPERVLKESMMNHENLVPFSINTRNYLYGAGISSLFCGYVANKGIVRACGYVSGVLQSHSNPSIMKYFLEKTLRYIPPALRLVSIAGSAVNFSRIYQQLPQEALDFVNHEINRSLIVTEWKNYLKEIIRETLVEECAGSKIRVLINMQD